MPFNTPVVLLAFDRPDLTARVLAEIAKQEPTTLLVIGDGPRPGVDSSAAKVAATRELFDHIDWDCDVRTNFSETNLGCKLRVASGLDWVFEQFEQAIILEDDCVPDPSFFNYCESLLGLYQHDERVSAISGNNFQFGRSRTDASYYFSKYPHCWGWASWRRAWKKLDLPLAQWPEFRDSGRLSETCLSQSEIDYWTHIFDCQHQGKIDSWAFPWAFSCWRTGALTALPKVNLVSNIGFGDQASHTSDGQHRLANLPVGSISDLVHAAEVIRHIDADEFTYQTVFRQPEPAVNPPKPGLLRRWMRSAEKRIQRFARR